MYVGVRVYEHSHLLPHHGAVVHISIPPPPRALATKSDLLREVVVWLCYCPLARPNGGHPLGSFWHRRQVGRELSPRLELIWAGAGHPHPHIEIYTNERVSVPFSCSTHAWLLESRGIEWLKEFIQHWAGQPGAQDIVKMDVSHTEFGTLTLVRSVQERHCCRQRVLHSILVFTHQVQRGPKFGNLLSCPKTCFRAGGACWHVSLLKCMERNAKSGVAAYNASQTVPYCRKLLRGKLHTVELYINSVSIYGRQKLPSGEGMTQSKAAVPAPPQISARGSGDSREELTARVLGF